MELSDTTQVTGDHKANKDIYDKHHLQGPGSASVASNTTVN